MKKISVFIMVLCFFLALPDTGHTQKRAAYAPGELLVKYRSPVRKTASRRHRLVWGVRSVRTFKKIGVQRVKLPRHMSVQDALEIYKRDPDVMFVEPNYYRHAAAVPNDTYFNRLWGLNNTGQSVNGTNGTDDADIDAPEAWEVTTGSSSVVVAVIDSGVDYNHPELAANIWTNTGETANSIDDDGSGYIDDVRGWDFVDNDNDPIDPNGHGSHVAGIIAAAGNNAIGVAGVSWTAKIMPLRVLNALGSGTVSDVVSAIEYANAKGADIINLSLGSSGPSLAEKAAIDASSAVVVCAAGNNGNNNDFNPSYPGSYTSANIIAVAATDQDDDLLFSSNFGTISVDVAAPGKNIYSTKPDRQTVWSDNFDDNDIADWTVGGTWGTTNSLSYSGSYSLTDSPGGNYSNSSDSSARRTLAFDLSAYSGAKLEFRIRGISETNYDFLYVQTSTNLSSWTNQNILIDDSSTYAGIHGDFSDKWYSAVVDLGDYDESSTVYIRFRFISDGDITRDGFYIDDLAVTAAASSYVGTVYQYLNGTSMATAFVSGIAALVKARNPSLSNTEIRAQIENTVDAKASLSNKVAAGGRVNAANAVLLPPAASSLSATVASADQIDLSWIDNASNETGFEIERKTGSGGTYSLIATIASNATTYSDSGLGSGVTFYYRVRAYNSYGKSGYSNEAGATISSGGGGGGGGGGCFIATAAYGSSMAPHVKILREFRDRFLLDNTTGNALMAFYYTFSPPIADIIADHDSLRAVVRLSLLPVVGMGWVVLKIGPLHSLALAILLCSGFLGLIRLKRKSRKG